MNRTRKCQRCDHTKAQHVDHGAFGTGRCKHCTCPRYNAGRRQKNPPALKLDTWVRLPGGAGSVRVRRQGQRRVLEYRPSRSKR